MILIITSCIAPPPQDNLALSEPKKRLQYTKESLKKILCSKVFDKIVICDNSSYTFGNSITEEALRNGIKLEVLSFMGDFDKVKDQGKGYGEGEIMEYVINNSVLLKDENVFCKITGRLYVDNIDKILKRISYNKNYFNILTLRFWKSIDTRFYIIKKSDYVKFLLHTYKYVNDKNNQWYEMKFRDSLKYAEFHQFPILPIIRGISGTHGKDDFKKDILYYFKVLLTKAHIHNTLFGAISAYIVLKITNGFHFKN